jgi:hypothetical protein
MEIQIAVSKVGRYAVLVVAVLKRQTPNEARRMRCA